MTDFDYENLQKKRTAQGARHKKGGSKSRKCTMPSDYLTKAQKEALNGPVTTILLNQPMDWETYKGLSETLQKTYLTNLRETYKPSATMMSRMFGCAATTVTAELRKKGLPVCKVGTGKPSKAQQAMWEAFCNGVVGGGDNKPAEEPQVTCYDIEAEELERAKLAALAESIVDAEEEIAAAESAHSARTFEPVAEPDDELTTALKEILDAVEADPYGDEAEELADAIIEASFKPVAARVRELNTTMTGSPGTVMDNIRDLLALFNDAPVEVKIEIRPYEGR